MNDAQEPHPLGLGAELLCLLLRSSQLARSRMPTRKGPTRCMAWGRLGSGKLDWARSRLYQNQILQENMRFKSFAEIYTMHSFA